MNIKNLFKTKIEIVQFRNGKYGARKKDFLIGWVFMSNSGNYTTLSNDKTPYSWQQFNSVEGVKEVIKKRELPPDIGSVIEVLYI